MALQDFSKCHVRERLTQWVAVRIRRCLHFREIMWDPGVVAVRLNRRQIYMAGDKILSSAGFEKLTSALHPVHTASFTRYSDNSRYYSEPWSRHWDSAQLCSWKCWSGDGQTGVCVCACGNVCVCVSHASVENVNTWAVAFTHGITEDLIISHLPDWPRHSEN